MTLLNVLQDEMKAAMKAHDQARLDALRLMVSAIRYVEVDTPNLSDEQTIAVLTKEAKKRREAIAAFTDAGHVEQAEQEKYELQLIEEYLPKMLNEEEVRVLVEQALTDSKPENFGMAMNAAMKAVNGGSDGGVVSKIVKELFSK